MNDVSRKAIQQIVSQPAWQYVVEFLKDELIDGKKPTTFKTEGKTAEMIALDVMAREKSAKLIENALKRISIIGNQKTFEKEDYK